MLLGERLRFLRTKNGFTQKQVSEALSIDRSTYTYYEIGKTNPDVHMLRKLSHLYNVSIDYLLENKVGLSAVNQSSDTYRVSTADLIEDSDVLTNLEKQMLINFRLIQEKEKLDIVNTLIQKNNEPT